MCHITYLRRKLHKLGRQLFLHLWDHQGYLKDLIVVEEREMVAAKLHVFNYHDFACVQRLLVRAYKQRKSLLPSSWLSVHLSTYITVACTGRILVKFDSGGYMVICRLTRTLFEIGQIWRLLPQHLNHMTAARIRCLVLCFALSNNT